ncbi:hypothetical protein FRACYDRAFT_244827 [Fragilariopsis cylindrus CCMP1102]|uniref:BTB domain-containing protein n=1 Tax=Fragilariopsis cylindrus CCMP1102 TaxID=635003 RepID=A0A1E7F0U2_9STRA|nr:hypothetical protein FRACYDRAFT_244827 [Fragilariopsis cylindrus CCMP1102]|eukprot:OEU11704.1 hypothetical protein FRACYDRAFT_244827 [Fragilariopsis cylindrus CCMP1102]
MSDTNTNAKIPTTVHFNVGGKIYEVSRSLIEKYPDSMLRTLISKTWLNDEHNDPLKIQLLFGLHEIRKSCVADHGIKDAILNDLDYYGFHGVDPNVFTFPITGGEAMKYINTLTEEKEMDVNFHTLAHYCFLRYKNSGTRDITFYVADDDYKDFHGRPGNIKFHEGKMEEIRTIVCSLKGNVQENKTTWACFSTVAARAAQAAASACDSNVLVVVTGGACLAAKVAAEVAVVATEATVESLSIQDSLIDAAEIQAAYLNTNTILSQNCVIEGDIANLQADSDLDSLKLSIEPTDHSKTAFRVETGIDLVIDSYK